MFKRDPRSKRRVAIGAGTLLVVAVLAAWVIARPEGGRTLRAKFVDPYFFRRMNPTIAPIETGAACSVNGEQVWLSDIARAKSQPGPALANPVPEEGRSTTGTGNRPDHENDLIDILVQRTLYDQLGPGMGVKVTQHSIDTALAKLQRQGMPGGQSLEQWLASRRTTMQDLRSATRHDLIARRMYQTITDPAATSDKVKRYYRAHPDEYSRPASRVVAHIVVATRAQALDVYERVRGGDQAVFGAQAKRYSRDRASASLGGVIVATESGDDPAFEQIAFDLRDQQVAPPARIRDGWEVIQARGPTTPRIVQPLADVRDQIEEHLRFIAITDWNAEVLRHFRPGVRCRNSLAWDRSIPIPSGGMVHFPKT